ncbi:MAG: transglycosylase SLT domain-containing protein [Bacteroidota bacterium]
MNFFGPTSRKRDQREASLVPSTQKQVLRFKGMGWVFVFLLISNFITYEWMNHQQGDHAAAVSQIVKSPVIKPLYLMERASLFIEDVGSFEGKVKQVSQHLKIAPEWLMAVMYAESGFNPASMGVRFRGNVGLIQLSVPAVKRLNRRLGTRLYMKDIQKMPAHYQLDLIHEYLSMIQEKYGKIETLTDCYLAVIHPEAMGQDYCYALSSKWEKGFSLLRQMDDNQDGIVSISDVDRQMRRMYPTAYLTDKSS